VLTSNGYVLDANRLGALEEVPDRERGDRDALRVRLARDGYLFLREGTDRVLSAWIPLGDCPVSRGGLTYLEGSHHRVLAEEAAGTLKRPAASITADLPALADQYDARWQSHWHDQDGL
jgi:hypothetical protein